LVPLRLELAGFDAYVCAATPANGTTGFRRLEIRRQNPGGSPQKTVKDFPRRGVRIRLFRAANPAQKKRRQNPAVSFSNPPPLDILTNRDIMIIK
jgi:hypothetical protein